MNRPTNYGTIFDSISQNSLIENIIEKYTEPQASSLFTKIFGIFSRLLNDNSIRNLCTCCKQSADLWSLYTQIQSGKMQACITDRLSQTSSFSGITPDILIQSELNKIVYLPHFLPLPSLFQLHNYNFPKTILDKIKDSRASDLTYFYTLCTALELKPPEESKEQDAPTERKEAEKENFSSIEWERFLFSQSPFPLKKGGFLSWYELLLHLKKDAPIFEGRVNYILKSLKCTRFLTESKVNLPPWDATLTQGTPSFTTYLAIRSILQICDLLNLPLSPLKSEIQTVDLEENTAPVRSLNLWDILLETVSPIFQCDETARAEFLFLLSCESFCDFEEIHVSKRALPFLKKIQLFSKIEKKLSGVPHNLDRVQLFSFILSAEPGEIEQIQVFFKTNDSSLLIAALNLFIFPSSIKLDLFIQNHGKKGEALDLFSQKHSIFQAIRKSQAENTDCSFLFAWIWNLTSLTLQLLINTPPTACQSKKSYELCLRLFPELCLSIPKQSSLFANILLVEEIDAFANLIFYLKTKISPFDQALFLENFLERYLDNISLRSNKNTNLILTNFTEIDRILNLYTSKDERKAHTDLSFWIDLAGHKKQLSLDSFKLLLHYVPPPKELYSIDLFSRFLIRYIKGGITEPLFQFSTGLDRAISPPLTQPEKMELLEALRNPPQEPFPPLEKIFSTLQNLKKSYPDLTSFKLGQLAFEFLKLGTSVMEKEVELLEKLEKFLNFSLSTQDVQGFLLYHPDINSLTNLMATLEKVEKGLLEHYAKAYQNLKHRYFIPENVETDFSNIKTLIIQIGCESFPSENDQFERFRASLLNFIVYRFKPSSPQLWTDYLCQEAGNPGAFLSGDKGEDGRVVIHSNEVSPLNPTYPLGPCLQRTWIVDKGTPATFQLSVISGKTLETFVTKVSFGLDWQELNQQEQNQKPSRLQLIRQLAKFLGGEKEIKNPTGDFLTDIKADHDSQTAWKNSKLPDHLGQSFYDSILQLKRGFSEGFFCISKPLSLPTEGSFTGHVYFSQKLGLSLFHEQSSTTKDMIDLYTEKGQPGEIARQILASIKENKPIKLFFKRYGKDIPLTYEYQKVSVEGHAWKNGNKIPTFTTFHDLAISGLSFRLSSRYSEIFFTEENKLRMITWQVLMFISELIRRAPRG